MAKFPFESIRDEINQITLEIQDHINELTLTPGVQVKIKLLELGGQKLAEAVFWLSHIARIEEEEAGNNGPRRQGFQ